MKRQPHFRSIIGSPLAPATRVVLGVIGTALVMVAYECVARHYQHEGRSPHFVPRLEDLYTALGELTEVDPRTGSIPLWADTLRSLSILGKGLGIGVAISSLAGVAMGALSSVHAMFAPTVIALAKVPTTALITLFMLVFGVTNDSFKIALLVFGVSPTLALGIAMVARAVPKNMIVKAYSLGATTFDVIRHAIVPQVVPQIIEMIRLSVGPALIYLIAAEHVNASVGFGHGIVLSSRMVRVDHIVVYVIWLAFLGVVIDAALHVVSRLVAPWAAARKDD